MMSWWPWLPTDPNPPQKKNYIKETIKTAIKSHLVLIASQAAYITQMGNGAFKLMLLVEKKLSRETFKRNTQDRLANSYSHWQALPDCWAREHCLAPILAWWVCTRTHWTQDRLVKVKNREESKFCNGHGESLKKLYSWVQLWKESMAWYAKMNEIW